jgi:hypothetical protein
MGDPFPLSGDDYNAFMYDLGNTLQWLPSWGGIYQWRNRYILAYVKPDYSAALTDISGGIPDSSVRGGYIPASILVASVPRTETTALEAFFYSLPSNFYAVAKERMAQLSDIAIEAAQTAGNVAAGALNPLGADVLWPIAIGLGAVLVFMYWPKSRAA